MKCIVCNLKKCIYKGFIFIRDPLSMDYEIIIFPKRNILYDDFMYIYTFHENTAVSSSFIVNSDLCSVLRITAKA